MAYNRRLGFVFRAAGEGSRVLPGPCVGLWPAFIGVISAPVRLVVDTGIHSKGWSRDQVVEFFRKSGAVDEPTLQAETDRYIFMAGAGR